MPVHTPKAASLQPAPFRSVYRLIPPGLGLSLAAVDKPVVCILLGFFTLPSWPLVIEMQDGAFLIIEIRADAHFHCGFPEPHTRGLRQAFSGFVRVFLA